MNSAPAGGVTDIPLFVERLAALRRAKDLIDRDFAEPLALDAMARVAGYSRYHFTRSFTQVFGRTPREYLSWRRVERARDLLGGANLTVPQQVVRVLKARTRPGMRDALYQANAGAKTPRKAGPTRWIRAESSRLRPFAPRTTDRALRERGLRPRYLRSSPRLP